MFDQSDPGPLGCVRVTAFADESLEGFRALKWNQLSKLCLNHCDALRLDKLPNLRVREPVATDIERLSQPIAQCHLRHEQPKAEYVVAELEK